jgi:hypothetical protein
MFRKKYPNILSFKLFGWVSCLFQFNGDIETLCFGIEAKQTVLKQTEKNRKKRKNRKNSEFSVKNSILARFGIWKSFAKNLNLYVLTEKKE